MMEWAKVPETFLGPCRLRLSLSLHGTSVRQLCNDLRSADSTRKPCQQDHRKCPSNSLAPTVLKVTPATSKSVRRPTATHAETPSKSGVVTDSARLRSSTSCQPSPGKNARAVVSVELNTSAESTPGIVPMAAYGKRITHRSGSASPVEALGTPRSQHDYSKDKAQSLGETFHSIHGFRQKSLSPGASPPPAQFWNRPPGTFFSPLSMKKRSHGRGGGR